MNKVEVIKKPFPRCIRCNRPISEVYGCFRFGDTWICFDCWNVMTKEEKEEIIMVLRGVYSAQTEPLVSFEEVFGKEVE